MLAVAHQRLVEEREPLALLGEGDTVARHGVPVMTCHVRSYLGHVGPCHIVISYLVRSC